MEFNLFLKNKNTYPKKNITKDILGGKGFGLAEMTQLGVNVPPGFTIPTHYCKLYYNSITECLEGVSDQLPEYLKKLEDYFGYLPLLSVRSGAPISMPGMMETVLNVGLTQDNLSAWMDQLGFRTALDCRRRLLSMLGENAYGVHKDVFDEYWYTKKDEAGVSLDKDIPLEVLADICDYYIQVCESQDHFNDTVEGQIKASIISVFESWDNEKARIYRKKNNIPFDIGTAVTVQAMVFGNMNDQSGSGVYFTRCPMTGYNKMVGEFLVNAQGEDVVAGVRTPTNLDDLKETEWEWLNSVLDKNAKLLEDYFGDMQDIEFTVQNNEVYILQSRTGKRQPLSAFNIAIDLYDACKIDKDDFLSRITLKDYINIKKPIIDPKGEHVKITTGLGASSGISIGRIALSPEYALKNKDCILVRKDTSPDDIAGMYASNGILTSTGGITCHAAVVARGMDKPCVVGCGNMFIMSDRVVFKGDMTFEVEEGQYISIDGSTGDIYFGVVDVISGDSLGVVSEYENILFSKYQGKSIRTKEVSHNMTISFDKIVVPVYEFMDLNRLHDILKGDMEDMYEPIYKLLEQSSKVVLDFSLDMRFTHASNLIYDILTGNDYELAFVNFGEHLAHRLVELGYKKITIIDPNNLIADNGLFYRIAKPKTMKDFFFMDSVIMDEDFIKNVVGDIDTWNYLLNQYNKNVFKSGEEIPNLIKKAA